MSIFLKSNRTVASFQSKGLQSGIAWSDTFLELRVSLHWHLFGVLKFASGLSHDLDSAADPERRHDPRDDKIGPSRARRSEEHTSELQSLMRISYAVFCLK